MKGKLLLMFGLLALQICNGQTTTIEDPNFEDYLIDKGFDTAPRDGKVLTSTISGITELNISNQGINDLTGLEDFISLEVLNVSDNDLNELRLSNLSLTTISANNCNLAGKPIRFINEAEGSFLINVTSLSLSNNALAGNSNGIIRFGGVPNVKLLTISDNNFKTLNLGNTTKIESISADNCPNLSTLNGLNSLQNLGGLTISNCDFTSLNISDNPALSSLLIFNNSISEMTFEQNPLLSVFRGANNAFNSLSFSQNPKLTFVDVSSNIMLNELNLANGNNGSITAFSATNTSLGCIQVDNANQADNTPGWQKDPATNYSTDCSAQTNEVEVSVISGQNTDGAGNFILTGTNGNNNIQLGFDVKDENGNQISNGDLPSYNLIINTNENTNENPATKGVDFDDFNDKTVQVNTIGDGPDNSNVAKDNEVSTIGDTLFEGDEFFFIEVSSNDPNITLKDAENGVVRIPVKIIDNENTDITLELIQNGIEPNQKARLRITSTFNGSPRLNNTGATMPFNIDLSGGNATIGDDYQDVTNPIEIADGASSVEFEIDILNNDGNPEQEEEFFATVTYAGDLPNQRVLLPSDPTRVVITDDGDVDDTSFAVTAMLTGAGAGPEYMINEGNSFNLNFDTGASGENDTTYNPIITITKNGENTTEDFTIDNIDKSFTISTDTPDGSILFTANDDGIAEGDETYVITVSSENTDVYTFEGDVSFEILIKDPLPQNGTTFSIQTSLVNIENGPYYEVEEGVNFQLQFEGDELANMGDTFSLEITYAIYNILEEEIFNDNTGETIGLEIFRTKQNSDEFPDVAIEGQSSDNVYQFEVKNGEPDGILTFNILNDNLPEETEEVIISITSQDPNITISNSNRYILKILRNDPTEVEVVLTGDVNANQMSVIEGNSFKLDFTGLNTDEPINFEASESTASYSISSYSNSEEDFNISSGSQSIGIDVVLDALQNENEIIKIKLPAPEENYTYKNSLPDGSLEFTIAIVDGAPFEVSAQLDGARLIGSNLYEVDEGETFTLSLEATNDQPDLVQVSYPLEIDTEQGSAKNGVDFTSDSDNTIVTYQSNTRYYETIIDGIPDPDEFIIITLPKPAQPYFWKDALPDGSLQFTVKVMDKNITEPIEDYLIGFRIYDEENAEFQPVVGDIITLTELDRLQIGLENDGFSTLEKGISIIARDGTAKLENNDYTFSNYFDQKTFRNYISFDLTFLDSDNDEQNENFFIEISPTTSNYRLLKPDNTVLDLNDIYILEVVVENENNSSSKREPQIITDYVRGAKEQIGDVFAKQYSSSAEKPVEILLNDFVPNLNEGKKYRLQYAIDETSSTLKKEDYSITIVNEIGDNLKKENNFFEYLVNQNNVFDAKITITLNEGLVLGSPKTLTLSLIPDVTEVDFGDNGANQFIPNAIFYESTLNSSDLNDLVYNITFSNENNGSLVYPVITHTGGVEGLVDKPDLITCTLKNGDNSEYNTHTSIIKIPIEFSNDITDGIAREDVRFSSLFFEFQPGESTATIKATYLHEKDELDAECNYYKLGLKQPTESSNTQIEILPPKILKVADYSEFLVFVDVVLDNVRPSIANLRFDDPNYPGDCTQCVAFYNVEENSTISFTVDAANGVPQARNSTDISNAYILDLDIDYSNNTGKASPLNLLGDIPDLSEIPLYVDEDDIDKTLKLDVKEVSENERFTVTFNEPQERKTYRFSQRESRTYGDSFEFRIINVVALDLAKNQTYGQIDEDDPNSFGEIEIKAKSNESFDSGTIVYFKLEGSAEYGTDYTFEKNSKNTINVTDNLGKVYFNSGDSAITLKILPEPDTDDERLETIKITLIDEFGYSVNNSFEELNIIDNERTDYEASITSSAEVIFENRTQKYTKEIEFQLTPENTSNDNIKLDISFDTESTATFNEDFKLYEIIEGQPNREILTNEDLYVTIETNESTAKLLIETLEDKANEADIVEGDEQVQINIDASDKYFAKDPKTVKIEIKDDAKEGDTPPSTTNGILAEVTSSSCITGANGRISMINGTDYSYRVSLFSSKGEPADDSKILEANKIEFSEIFKDLRPDTYTIYLSYLLDNGTSAPTNDVLPPSFTLTIKTAEEVKLIQSTTNKQLKLASLTVSGSYSYQIDNNGKTYTYNFGSTDSHDVEVPLQYGQNELRIKGDSECQGVLKTSIVLDNIVTYPNPSAHMLYISGFEPNTLITAQISDSSGRLVINREILTTSSTLELDVSSYSKGVYICKLSNESGMSSTFKLVKK